MTQLTMSESLNEDIKSVFNLREAVAQKVKEYIENVLDELGEQEFLELNSNNLNEEVRIQFGLFNYHYEKVDCLKKTYHSLGNVLQYTTYDVYGKDGGKTELGSLHFEDMVNLADSISKHFENLEHEKE